jgi:ubiquinone/menaquinone biosynthesis C-methylase UbiE
MKEVYTLQVGEEGKQRLNTLNKLYNESTQKFLLSSGLQAGMEVLEAGCGTGEMACWIAEQVGPQGTVLAIDSSQEQLALAVNFAQIKGMSNISHQVKSIYDLTEEQGSFDLIFSRWVIGHLNNPEKGLTTLFNRLKPGGILITEAFHLDSTFSYPKSLALSQWRDIWTAVLAANGKDIRLSYELKHLMEKIGCCALKVNLFQPIMTSAEEKLQYYQNIKESYKFVLDSKIIHKDALDQILLELKKFAYEDHLVGHMRSMQVSGIKLK